jgi:hypothetical protein
MAFSEVSFSQVTLGGSKGLLRIHDADTVYPGYLYINGVYSGYTRKNEEKTNLVEDHTINLSFTLGLSRVFELYLHTVPYQDDQKSLWGPPGDTQFGVKICPSKGGHFFEWGFAGFLSFPTALHHNVPFESFSADAEGWGLLGLLSLDLKNSSLRFPLKMSVNFGYRDHDWYDHFFIASQDQLIGGCGIKFPIGSSYLFTEITGEVFMNNPEQVAFKQNSFRVTQGLRFPGPFHLVMDVGFDYDFIDYKPVIAEYRDNPYLKDYADWKIIFGIAYRTTVFKYVSREEETQKATTRLEKEKLDAIKEKRENVIKELEELRKKLDNEKKEP